MDYVTNQILSNGWWTWSIVLLMGSARLLVMKDTTSISNSSQAQRQDEDEAQPALPCLEIPPIASLLLEDMPSSPQMQSTSASQRNKQWYAVGDRISSLKILTTDDHTLETVSTDEETEGEMDESFTSLSSTSSNNGSNSVSFAEPLVTNVWYRPIVETMAEKQLLFYSDQDYQAFRLDFVRIQRAAYWRRQGYLRQESLLAECNSSPRPRKKMVQFPQDQVVTQIFEYAQLTTPEDKKDLFYSEQDLERFLDDFVTSLNGAWGSST